MATWSTIVDGTTAVDAASVNQVANHIGATHDPTSDLTLKQVSDEVVAARGSEVDLDTRLDVSLNENGYLLANSVWFENLNVPTYSGLENDGSSNIQVAVDDSTIERASTGDGELQLKDAGITAAKIADQTILFKQLEEQVIEHYISADMMSAGAGSPVLTTPSGYAPFKVWQLAKGDSLYMNFKIPGAYPVSSPPDVTVVIFSVFDSAGAGDIHMSVDKKGASITVGHPMNAAVVNVFDDTFTVTNLHLMKQHNCTGFTSTAEPFIGVEIERVNDASDTYDADWYIVGVWVWYNFT